MKKQLIENLAEEVGLLNIKAAAKYLGLSAGAVKTLAESGKLAAVELDGKKFFSRRVLENFRREAVIAAAGDDRELYRSARVLTCQF